jgi:hypothetical protein
MKQVIHIGAFIVGAVTIVILAAVIYTANQTPDASDVTVEQFGQFPSLTGINLMLEQQTAPDDLDGTFKLIVVAYDTDQQVIVNKWLRPLEQLNESYPELHG